MMKVENAESEYNEDDFEETQNFNPNYLNTINYNQSKGNTKSK